jgi:hypothetical protein
MKHCNVYLDLISQRRNGKWNSAGNDTLTNIAQVQLIHYLYVQ